MNVADGRKVVTTAGTRVQLGASQSINRVAVTALEANTGLICVGGKTVVAKAENRTGLPLAAKQTTTIETDDLGDLYIDSTVNAEGVSWLAVTDE
jgi:hypothetical protein